MLTTSPGRSSVKVSPHWSRLTQMKRLIHVPVRLIEVLKMAAHSVKKELILPAVALDLLKLSLKEDSFQLFWNKAVTEGMFKEPSGPTQ